MKDATDIELVPTNEVAHPKNTTALAVPTDSPAAIMFNMLERGASLESIEKMMDLQDRYEKREAQKAYNAAFAAFKSEAVRIIKGREVTDGPLRGRSYAELSDIVHAVTPALSRHGLSASWRLTKDEPQWIEITCYLKHVDGHSESVSMGGAPDTGGAKNALQARASTKTYLERYTLKAILGVAEGGEDTDGAEGAPDEPPAWPDDKFKQVLPRMVKGIVEKGKSIEDALAWLNAKGQVTEAQAAKLAQAVEQAKAESKLVMTADYVAQRLQAAKTIDQLHEAASLIGDVAEGKEQLNHLFEQLAAAMEQS